MRDLVFLFLTLIFWVGVVEWGRVCELKFMELNKSKDKEYKLPCVNCDNETYHKVLFSVEEAEFYEGPDIHYFYEDQIIMCQGCKKISFRSNWQSSVDVYDSMDGIELIDHEDLYPSRIAGRKELKDCHHLPSEIYTIYKEIYSALCYRMSILAGVGIRILVEVICNNKKAKGNKLENKIDNLVEIGVLTKEGAEILHGTRLLGNQAAHETKPIGEQTLDEAMGVVEHLLTGAYILPQKTKNLPKRK